MLAKVQSWLISTCNARVLRTPVASSCMQGRPAASATTSPEEPPSLFASAKDAKLGEGETSFVENAPVAELIALMPRAIAALSEQARTGEDGEPLNGHSPTLLASNVPLATFNALQCSETRPGGSLSYDAASGSVFIYELPKDGHNDISDEIKVLFGCYSQAQAGRRDPPGLKDFRMMGSSNVSLGCSGDRLPDASFRAIASVHTAVPVFVVEVCNIQTLAQGDARAQAWLLSPHLASLVQAVLVIKYWPRRRGVGGGYAAVAALYEQGGGPGAIARTVNLAAPLDPAAVPPAAPQVFIPGVPPVPPAFAAAPAVDAAQPLLPVPAPPPAALPGSVAVTPIAPTRVVSFGTAPPWAGFAMQDVNGLGTAPEGVGFPGAGLCNGAACDVTGVPGYALRVPAARLYFGVPAGPLLPAGFQPDPRFPDAANDLSLDLHPLSFALDLALPRP